MATSPDARVTIEDGIIFGRGGGRDLRLDLFRPPAAVANGTGVLLVHGGGWIQGDRSQLRGYGILLGRLGYTCVASEYRLSGESAWPAQIHDVKAALRWMRANSGRLGIDATRIAISGNSAGAHLALMAAATPNDPAFEGEGGHAGAGTEVAAAIAFYAPTNLEVRAGARLDDVIVALMGGDTSEARLRSASPLHFARREFPPTLLFSGNNDEIVHVDESLRMYRALVGAGARAELHLYEGAPHAFDSLADFGRQCASIMALFLDRHVVRPRPVVVVNA